ncbi:triacylglycerol lipase, partial [Dimargaris verticillata]
SLSSASWRPWLSHAWDRGTALLFAWVYLWVEVLRYWSARIGQLLWRPTAEQTLMGQLAQATRYEDYYQAATSLDCLTTTATTRHRRDVNHRLPTAVVTNDDWRRNPISRGYDYQLIIRRLELLCAMDMTRDLPAMVYVLRSGLVRNLGGINERHMFTRCYAGTTKLLIEEYTFRLVNILHFILRTEAPKTVPRHLKASFFYDTRQCYGRTALLLQGGTTFGLCHLGVVKALYEAHLLPQIIGGTAVGALIAALVCCQTDETLPGVLQTNGIDLSALTRAPGKDRFRLKLARFIQFGYLLNVKVLERCLRDNIGDITFEEAYRKTGRILNIMIPSTYASEAPHLLNYLTAPNVVVWSAACASTAQLGLFEQVSLVIKDPLGTLVTWSTPMAPSSDSSSASRSSGGGRGSGWDGWGDVHQPFSRLAELFNVNHHIISNASPHQFPWVVLPKPLGQILCFHGCHPIRTLARLVWDEVRYRLQQLHMLPRFLTPFAMAGGGSNFALLSSSSPFLPAPNLPTANDTLCPVTISPSFTLRDFYHMYSRPTRESLRYWILKGEQATWPIIPLVRNRCLVEFTLDYALDFLNQARKHTPASNRDKPAPLLRRRRTISVQ